MKSVSAEEITVATGLKMVISHAEALWGALSDA
jgi:hypothetical protein